MVVLLLTGWGFLVGSVPFSLWLGRLLLHTDIRSYGRDGNPGAVNAFRAGGWRVGVPALLLDYAKGAVPVGVAHLGFRVPDWELVPIALAPVVGHAFSPFLNFRGGKAVATTFGIWTGLTLGEGPIILGACLTLLYLVQAADAWSIILAMLVWLAYLLLRGSDLVTETIWSGNMLILVWKHRRDLHEPIRLRPHLLHFLKR